MSWSQLPSAQQPAKETGDAYSIRPSYFGENGGVRRVDFYKSGDPQFGNLRVAINSRTFKTFDSLLDNLSKKIPLPFGVRTITTPLGVHHITSLEDFQDGNAYICSDQKKVKPINFELASRKPVPWLFSRPATAQHRVTLLARQYGHFIQDPTMAIRPGRKLIVFKNGISGGNRTLILNRKTVMNFDALLNHITELMRFPVIKLYTTDGRKIDSLYSLKQAYGSVVAAGREVFKHRRYDSPKYEYQQQSLAGKLPAISNRVHPLPINKKDIGRSYGNYSFTREDIPTMPSEDDIEKSVRVNEDGSMTVEMRVRFRLKEEETIKWSTTVSRASVLNKINSSCKSKLECNAESLDVNAVKCGKSSEAMYLEDLIHKQELDDISTRKEDTMCLKQEKEIYYDIWQNFTPGAGEDLPGSGTEIKPCYPRKGTPGPRNIRQKQISVESITAISDTETGANMLQQFLYQEETETGDSRVEFWAVNHCTGRPSSRSNKNGPCEMSVGAVLDEMSILEKINVNSPGEEKRILDKKSSFDVNNSSSLYAELHLEDEGELPKPINSINENKNAMNIFSQPRSNLKRFDVDISFGKINLRPASAGPMYSTSKQDQSDVKRPMSASFRQFGLSVLTNNGAGTLSSDMVEPLMSLERKQASENIRKNKESPRCATENDQDYVTDGFLSQPTQTPEQVEKVEHLNDDCAIEIDGQALMELIEADSYLNRRPQSPQSNTSQCSVRSKVAFQIGSSDESLASCSVTNLRAPKAESDCCLSDLPVMCSSKEKPRSAGTENKTLPGKKEKDSINSSPNSSATTSTSENVSEINDHQDHLSEPKQNTLREVSDKELNVYHDKGVKCNEGNSDLSENCLQALNGNIAGVDNNEDDLQKCSPSVTRRKWKKRSRKSQHVYDVAGEEIAEKKELTDESQSPSILSASEQRKEQELSTADVSQASLDDFVKNWLSSIPSPSDWAHSDLNLSCCSPVDQQFEEEQEDESMDKGITEEADEITDENSDFINQIKQHIIDTNLPIKKELVQKSSLIVTKLERLDEISEEVYFKNDSLQTRVNINEESGEPATDATGAQCLTGTQMAVQKDLKKSNNGLRDGLGHQKNVNKLKAEMVESMKETAEVGIQVDMELGSETTDGKGFILGGGDLKQLLRKLQSTINTMKSQSHTKYNSFVSNSQIPSSLPEHLSSTLSTSSKVLLAWLAIMDLDVGVLTSHDNNTLLPSSCSSEISTFLQSIKHITTFEESDNLMESIVDLQKSTSYLVKVWKDQQEKSIPDSENDAGAESSAQAETLSDEASALFNASQPFDRLKDEMCFQIRTEQLSITGDAEAKEEMEHIAVVEEKSNICKGGGDFKISLSSKEVTKDKEDAETEPLSSKEGSECPGISEEQTHFFFRNEDTAIDTTVKDKRCDTKKSIDRGNCTDGCNYMEDFEVLHQAKDMETAESTEDNEGQYNNCTDNSKDCLSEKVTENDTGVHFTFAESIENCELMSAASVQSFVPLMSPISDIKCRLHHTEVVCQRESRNRSESSEEPISRPSTAASVASRSDTETEGEKMGKKLVRKQEIHNKPISEENEVGEMKSVLPVCSSVTINQNAKQLKSQQTSYSSESRQDSVNSDYNSQASNEMTTEGEEETFIKTKHFSVSFVKQATARLYGKSRVAAQSRSQNRLPPTCTGAKTVLGNGSKIDSTMSLEAATCPDKSNLGGSCSNNGESLTACGLLENLKLLKSGDKSAQSDDDGVLIDKGRWLLKENHLIRKSPPLNMGMYSNLDTTSADTALDNTSEDIAYPHAGTLHSVPPLAELSSSEIEEMIKPSCNYFSMPHGSDSEPFPDLLSLKSKSSLACNNPHPLMNKIASERQLVRASSEPLHMCEEVNDNNSSFTTVNFHMFENKVRPTAEPLPSGNIVAQPSPERARSTTTVREQDSLDKLHFICGQHCPILRAVVEPINEKSRGFVYQKRSDPENCWLLHLDKANDIYGIKKYNDSIAAQEFCIDFSKSVWSDVTNWFKTQSIENEIKRMKLRLDAKSLSSTIKTLKSPADAKKSGSKHIDKPLASNQVRKVHIKNIVEAWFKEQRKDDSIRAVNERSRNLSCQSQRVEDIPAGKTDHYLLNTRSIMTMSNLTVPSLGARVIDPAMPSEKASTDEAAVIYDRTILSPRQGNVQNKNTNINHTCPVERERREGYITVQDYHSFFKKQEK
eukprot:gi/632947787/ref/XP_007889226.1/ PREDICTED: oxygen-regulated protein 1 [Callorhinchus milii]